MGHHANRVRRRSEETQRGPGIISSSLWSPVNGPTSHKGQHNGNHTGSEDTSKGCAHFFRSHNTEERVVGRENIALHSHLQI